jgi:hypothetical protein
MNINSNNFRVHYDGNVGDNFYFSPNTGKTLIEATNELLHLSKSGKWPATEYKIIYTTNHKKDEDEHEVHVVAGSFSLKEAIRILKLNSI